MASSRYQRTQVYLDPYEHRRLRRLAAERGVSMTTVVREAVGQYLVDAESDDDGADFVARLREIAELPEAPDHPAASPLDIEIGEGLWREHEQHIRDWEARRAREADGE